ncbi:SLC13 family permease [uncultured Thiodictyon sp.]|jgi:di/tricarboxylate transporter|uniref:SLC13 family permease n=1 Tax=uncultured Thiodictyon sp. TaxID=1846217 RepID=UPI0025D8D237|nr:SLC13 family permease [uncultured Thiodictyon sp.]
MTDHMMIVFGILAGAIALFAWGRLRADMVAILVVLALMLSGVLTPQESLAGFGDPVVVLIAGMFIVSEALVSTGVAHRLGDAVLRAGAGSEARLIALVMALAGGVGAFMSSSAIVAMLIPVVLAIADKTGLNRKRMLMPLSVAALTSGMMTLIASSPNLIVEAALRAQHLAPLGFFSWAPFGLAVLAVGMLFMLAARNWLSRSRSAAADGARQASVVDLITAYGLAAWWHRLRVPAGSPLLAQSVAAARLRSRFGCVIVGLERQRDGQMQGVPALPETVFEVEDAIIVVADAPQVESLIAAHRLIRLPPLSDRQRYEVLQEVGAAEIMLAPESKLIGKTLREIEFRGRYRATVIAVRHRGKPLTMNLVDEPLDFGDTLLVLGDWDDIRRLGEDRQNFVVLALPAEYRERLPARGRAPAAVGILALMITVMALELLPNTATVLIAALLMVATGCVKLDSIYRVISWKTVVLIAGMLPLATALTKTGATVLMANQLVAALGSLGPIAMLAVLFLVTAVVGLFISNSATAVLIAPIAIQAAQSLHVSPQAFAMTVSIACCAAFVTPVSSPVNMLVMEPGGYRFGDYVKVGLPLLLLTMVVTIALVALIYLY